MRRDLFVLLPFILLGCATGCNNSSSIVRKEVSYILEGQPAIKSDVHFFNNNLDVPYSNVEDIVNYYLLDTNYTVIKMDENEVVIKNRKNASTLNIDVKTGIATYAEFSKFMSPLKSGTLNYIDEFYYPMFPLNKQVTEESYYKNNVSYSVDLSKFGFKPIYYQQKVYLPLDIPLTLLGTAYGTFFYDGADKIYQVNNRALVNESLVGKEQYSKAYYEYSYNKFMLNTELYFGLKGYSRKQRSGTQKTLSYFPNGVYETLNPLKNSVINASSVTQFDDKIMDIIFEYMDDGGHTIAQARSFGKEKTAVKYSQEVELFDTNIKAVKELRKNSPDANKDGKFDYLQCFDTDGNGKYDIAYFTFDVFTTVYDIFTQQEGICDILADNINPVVNPNNSKYDATKYEIKDIVIDLSGNTGGSVVAEGDVLAWFMGGKANELLRGTNGHAESKYTYVFDCANDYKFDKEDYLPSTINKYVAISGVTYSAANSFAYNCAYYNRTASDNEKIRLLGSRTGGGACSITDNIILPTGFTYRTAGNDVTVDPLDITKISEDGMLPTTGYEMEVSRIVNRSNKSQNCLNDFIVSKR